MQPSAVTLSLVILLSLTFGDTHGASSRIRILQFSIIIDKFPERSKDDSAKSLSTTVLSGAVSIKIGRPKIGRKRGLLKAISTNYRQIPNDLLRTVSRKEIFARLQPEKVLLHAMQ